MFVFNFKLDHKLVFKICFILLFIIVLVITGISVYKVFYSEKVQDELPIPNVANISSDNYTNILKAVHENLDEYVRSKNKLHRIRLSRL